MHPRRIFRRGCDFHPHPVLHKLLLKVWAPVPANLPTASRLATLRVTSLDRAVSLQGRAGPRIAHLAQGPGGSAANQEVFTLLGEYGDQGIDRPIVADLAQGPGSDAPHVDDPGLAAY